MGRWLQAQLFEKLFVLFPQITARLTRQRAQILADLTNKYGGSSWIQQSPLWEKWLEEFRLALAEKRAYIAVGSDARQDVRRVPLGSSGASRPWSSA